jgi:hypothetical protein
VYPDLSQFCFDQTLAEYPLSQIVAVERVSVAIAEHPVGHLRPLPFERFFVPRVM